MSTALAHLPKRYGPWAVVTGASDGIGRELAVTLAAAGMSVVLIARREQRLEALAIDLRARHPVNTRVIAADLGTDQGVQQVIRGTDDLDVGLLVAAAGFGTSGPFAEASMADELAMIDLNVRAVAALTHHFARRMVARGRGGLVLMSSLLAFQGVPRAANYAATKAYIQTLVEGLRSELAPHGVDVIASAPGPIHSGFAGRAGMTMSMGQTPSAVAQATLKALGRGTTVRPGWLSKVLELSLACLPRRGRSWILARVMAGMTKRLSAPPRPAAS